MSGYEEAKGILHVIWLWLPLGLQIGAFLLTLIFGVYLAKQQDLSIVHMFLAGCVGILGAMIGGRVWVELWSTGSIGLSGQFWGGQRGVIGVLLGAALCAGVYLKMFKQSVTVYADAALPALTIGYMVARLGCLAAGDDFGVPTGVLWGIYFGPDTEAYQTHLSRGWIVAGSSSSLAVHPTQIYHFLSAAVAFAVLKSGFIADRDLRLICIVIFYGVTRFFIQFFRDDHWQVSQHLDSAQIASLIFIIVGITMFIFHSRKVVKKFKVVSAVE